MHVRDELEALGLVGLRQDLRRQGAARRRADHAEARLEGGARRRPARSPSAIAAAAPETFTTVMGAENGKRRIFIDFHRNARSATAVAPYSLRARNNLPASAPLTWEDLAVHRRPGGFELFYAPGPGRRFRRSLGGRSTTAPGSCRRRSASRAAIGSGETTMAPRASWKGYLKLSLVSCPVRLYPATSGSERMRFNQLHKDTHNRINMKPVDPELGLVERSDLVKGYEYEDKKYIIIEDERPRSGEDRVQPHAEHRGVRRRGRGRRRSTRTRPTTSRPTGRWRRRPSSCCARRCASAGKVAIARLVLSSRERVVTIGAAREGHVRLHAARAERGARDRRPISTRSPTAKPDPEMLQLAEALIEQKIDASSTRRTTRTATRWR